jgi:hypothetical protein
MSRASDDEVAAALGQLLRRATDAREEARRDVPELRRHDAATRQRLVEAIGDGAGADARATGSPLAAALAWLVSTWRGRGALAALAAVAALAVVFLARSPELDYRIGGASEVAGYIRAEAGAATVSFEDGTVLELAPGSSGRLGDVRSNGARFVLEDGAVDARVEKRPGAAWSVHAGPWEVRVTGTKFTVGWDARRRAMRVTMREGSVTVHGPGAEAGIGLRAGQTLEVDGEGTIQVASVAYDAGPPAAPEPPAPSGGGAAPVAEIAKSAPVAPVPAVADAPARPWAARVAAGDYDGVLADAEARGVDAVLGAAPAADLSALADAARYRGRGALASRALQALRDRFPGTAAAANAAFLLGRMADDTGSAAAAIRWYDVHLAEGGAFASEALGRKMLAVRRSSGDAAAAAVARTYLERFPGGGHAAIARTLVGEAAAPAPDGASLGPGGERADPGVMPTSP